MCDILCLLDGEESDCSLNPNKKKKNEHRESQQSPSLPKPPEFLSNTRVAPEQNNNDTTSKYIILFIFKNIPVGGCCINYQHPIYMPMRPNLLVRYACE